MAKRPEDDPAPAKLSGQVPGAPPRLCVVLNFPGAPLRPLLEGLRRRGVQVKLVEGPGDAMAALAAGPQAMLVAVEPKRQRHLDELIVSVRREFPRTVCWQYDPQGDGLTPMRVPRKPLAAVGREAGQLPEGLPGELPGELTPEELAMLLGTTLAPPDDGTTPNRLLPSSHDGMAEHLHTFAEPPSRPRFATPDPQTPPLEASDEGQLLEMLLHDQPQLIPAAVSLAGCRAGIEGLVWCEHTSAIPSARVSAAVTRNGETLGYLHAAAPANLTALEPLIPWLARWVALRRKIERLSLHAHTDPLTGLYNRRYFDQRLAELLDEAARHRHRVTLMVYDFDDFKAYNDRFGHAAGDEILRESARLMRSIVRGHDVVARIGGDEFAVIFWDHDEPRRPNSQHPTDIAQAAERFRQAIAQHRFPKLGRDAPGPLTISGGLASYPWDGRTAAELLEKADRMTLESKREGKNALKFGNGG